MLAKIGKFWKWIAGFFVSLGAILGVLDYFLKWGILQAVRDWSIVVFDFATRNWLGLVTFLLALSILMLWRGLRLVEKYVAISFKDDFRGNLGSWDFTGSWEIVPGGGELSVTDSHIGGITKVGHLWTDYSFEFDAVIVNDRIGWIIRAQDLFNYYMIQLTPTLIRPHLLFGANWLLLAEHPHNLELGLNVPMRIRTDARGSEIRVYVNDQEVYYDNKFFSMKFVQVTSRDTGQELAVVPIQPSTVIVPAFSTGRVGFRLWGTEHGRFSKCRVKRLV